MLTTTRVCEIARALPGVTEYEHFGSDAFRTKGGTFVTVWRTKNSVNLKLTVEQQRRFVLLDGEGFVEIDNAWGRQGWTTANLEFAPDDAVREALQVAWSNTVNKPPRKRAPRKTAK
jgi:YjbR